MLRIFQNLKKIVKRELFILWIFSLLLESALIVLANKNKLPLGKGDFVFISILALCVALYRPRWAFFLFISLVPLENIILVSGFLPVQLRPYQYTGVIIALALIILWLSGRLSFKLQKPLWIDWLVFSLVLSSFFSLINSSYKNIGLKNNLIILSFVVLYYLVRNFIRKKEDLVKSAFFFLGSNLVGLIYGFWQVFADKFGRPSFEVMFGRPNSTLAEPDWLGIYLCFALAVLLAVIVRSSSAQNDNTANIKKIILYILVFLNLTLLILTLSRSAWIGAAAILFLYLLFNLYRKDNEKIIFTPREFANKLAAIFLILITSLAVIQLGKLSKFDIFDRARSTATSEQKITIACENNSTIPSSVAHTAELTKYGCQHINLEEIEFYKSKGKIIAQTFRKDPNVLTRHQIYQKSLEIILKHPILGVGFGAITQALGADERGAGLNESNLFLQVWAGSGIWGVMAFSVIIIYLFIFSFRRLSPICPLNKLIGCPIMKDEFERTTNLFIILGLVALIIPNLFNAGLFMGLIWLALGIFISSIQPSLK